MLFLLKRSVTTALVGLAVLVVLGLVLRHLLGGGVPLGVSWRAGLLGIAVCAAVLTSDAAIHGLLLMLFGERYRRRHRELVGVFAGQGWAAMLTGALMAGVGEELVFRGLSLAPAYQVGATVLFGLLHHVRRSLWPFTVWAVYQGLLFAAALSWSRVLFVTMTAHFLHDLAGFLLFRWLNRAAKSSV